MSQTVYIHNERESISSKAVKRYLKMIDRKNSLVRIFETKEFNHIPAPIHRSLMQLCDIEEQYYHNRPVWILKPKQGKSEKVIFFSHGGGHLNNITSHHWKMVEFLIKNTGVTFIVPDYPLMPDANYKETFAMMEEVFYNTVKDIRSENLIFLGDSSGGAISLALAQLIRDQQANIQPNQIFLIAPELDASKLHEDVHEIAPYDVMLSPKIFDVISSHYVADCPRDHFLVSPGLGDLSGLGKISFFVGTHDILFPYTQDLRKRLEAENRTYNYFEYPKMIHVWMALTFMKEARSALRQMANLINEGK